MKKKLLAFLFVVAICISSAIPAFAAHNGAYLYDEAELLTQGEADRLSAKLDAVSQKYQVDVIIATVNSTGSYTADEYVEYFYDSNGFGYGSNRDGVLLLVAMQERDYRILSNGLGADAISMSDIDAIGNEIVPYLSDGEYAQAFDTFVDECEYYINGEINGFPFNFGMNLLTALIVGIVVALVVTGIMIGQLKSVRRQSGAANYTKTDSMHITRSNDFFLYRTVNRVKKETQSSGSSRSGGSSRNVGGGKF